MALGANANLVNIIIRARDQTRAAFASAKSSIAKTKTATSNLNKSLTSASAGFTKIGSNVRGFGSKLKGLMSSAITPLIGVVGIAGIAIALKKSSDAFASFEQAAANASSVTGKVGIAFQETKKHIMDVSKVLGETTVFKASEAADAFYDLASAGYDVANITKTELKPILDLAAASQTNLKATTELVTSTLGQFGMGIESSGKIADIFARTIGSSKATMEKLGNSMVYVGPVAHALGRSLEETSATLGVLYNKGFDASMAGTALRGALSRLMNPSAQVNAKLSELGVTVAEVNPETHSMADILDTLTAAGMDTADAMELFGLRAGPAMLALTNNTDDIRELTVSLGDAGGAAETMASQQLTTFEGQMKLVKSKIEAFMLNLGEMTAPAILAVANTLTDHILPALETVYTAISTGFSEAFESVGRQIGPVLEPLLVKLRETGDAIGAGLDFKTLTDDVGVFIGAALNPLIQAFTWLIDRLGPLWALLSQGTALFHSLANALKTEEGRLDDIRDATEEVTAAKQTLYDTNEKLRNATKTLADEIRDAGGWTESLSTLEADAKSKTDALAEARKAATTAIADHSAGSEIARAAIDKVKVAEEAAKHATESYQSVLDASVQKFIDAGVATEGLQEAHVGLETASNNSLTAQENLQTAISNLATEIEESKQAPFDLGEAFSNFGKNVKEIFAELPLKIAEAFAKMYDIVATVFSDLGKKISEFGEKVPDFLGGAFVEDVGESFTGISDKFDTCAEEIESRVNAVRDSFEENLEVPLKDGITEASEAAEEAMDGAMTAVVAGAENAGDAIDALKEKTKEVGEESITAGDTAEEAYKDIELQVGDTEVTIKNLSGELGNNVTAFENMEEAASKLMDLDWSVFTEFEASLPNIEVGIGDMESSFVGLKGILEDNIGALDNVRESVLDIGEIAAPFLEAGFLDGIKSIGDFAGALSDAGSAINTFSSIQDVSIDGCINFSLHVRDMVSALEILESQMEDLVPSFAKMDSLITDIADAFLYGGDKAEGFRGVFEEIIGSAYDLMDNSERSFKDFKEIVDNSLDTKTITYWGRALDSNNVETDRWRTITVDNFWQVERGLQDAGEAANLFFRIGDWAKTTEFFSQSTDVIIDWAKNVYGATLITEELNSVMALSSEEQRDWLRNFVASNTILENTFSKNSEGLRKWAKEIFGVSISTEEAFKVMSMSAEEQQKWVDDLMHSEAALTFQMDKQTGTLKSQTDQLKKITDALQPYLEFMRTLNELAALSTLSTEELNAGLNSINDTLVNLGSALSTFDLRPVMESLFGTKMTEGDLEKFTGGTATGFTKVMIDYQTEFNDLIVYVTRLSNAINGLVSAFNSLTHISESVLSDQTKLKDMLGEITDIMDNFSKALGESGFAKKLADGFASMLESAKPLIKYFQDNNAAIELFNSTLTTFKNTISNVVGTMGMLKEMSEMVLPSVDELEAGFERAEEAVLRFQEAMLKHIGIDIKAGIFDEEKFRDNVFTGITNFVADWNEATEDMVTDFETFGKATGVITELISDINSLVSAFQTLADMPLITSDQIVEGFEKIKDTIEEVNKGMKQFAAEGLSELVTSLASVAKQWLDWDEKLGDSDSTFGEAVSSISTLVNAITNLITVQAKLAEMDMVSDADFTTFFKNISDQIHEIGEGMLKFTEEGGLTSLTNNLSNVNKIWSLWMSEMGTSLTTFDDASSGIGGLANSVSGLVGTFISLAEMPVITADAFSASMKDMSKNIENFASALKDNIATIEKALEAVDDAWSDYADNMAKLVPIFKDATDAINTLAGGIMSVVRSFESLKEVKFEEVFATGFENLTKATSEFASALKNNIDGLLTSLNALVQGWLANEEETVYLMRAFITIANNFIIVIDHAKRLRDAFSDMATGSVLAKAGLEKLIKFINDVITGIKGLYTTEASNNLIQFIMRIGWVVYAFNTLNEAIKTAMSTVERKVNDTVNAAKSKVSELSNIPSSAYTWGADIIYNFVEGMRAMEFYLKGELIYLADLIAFYLGVGSNTKLGALSHLTDWPKNLVKTFADGIKKGTPEISKALSSLTLPTENLHMPGGYAGILGGAGNTVTMYNTWNVGNQHDADYAIEQIETQLLRKRVL